MAERPLRRMELNEALQAVGELGPFQYLIFACLFIVGAFHGARMTSGYYFLYDQEHRCYTAPPDSNTTTPHPPNLFNNGSSPSSNDDASCYVSSNTSMPAFHALKQWEDKAWADGDASESHIRCPHGWVYDDSVMKWTATAEYDLVCEKKFYTSHANTALMLGSLLGAIAFGKISDRFGRKVCFHIALIMFIAFGVGMPFSNNFYTFVVTYGLSGAASTGLFAASIVTAMEYVLPQHRKIPALLMNVFFPIGELIMTGVAFGFRDWRWVGLTISAPAVLLLSYYWIVPESLRWLMLHKKYDLLDKTLRRVAKFNGRTVPVQEDDDDDEESFADLLRSIEHEYEVERIIQRKDSFFHLFKHCVLTFRVVCITYNWLVVNLAYYGLVFYSSDLGQGLYMNFLLGAIVEAPAHLLSLVLVDRIGRKYIHCFYFLLVAIATGISIIVCFEVEDTKTILLLMTMIGKFGAAGLTGTSFLWMTELFPTSVRSTGLGVGSASARVGAILSSYVILWGDRMESTLGKALPYMVFCITSTLAFVACIFLPETSNRNLPSTIQEARHFGRKQERRAPGEAAVPLNVNYGAVGYNPLQA